MEPTDETSPVSDSNLQPSDQESWTVLLVKPSRLYITHSVVLENYKKETALKEA